MKITISGKPGSGKSTVAKRVAKDLGYTHYSMGDLQRQIAKEKGLTMIELAELEEKDASIDRAVDDRQTYIGKNEDDFVMDGRISWYFIPDSVKIFLDVEDDTGAERILKAKRDDERFSTIEKAKDELKKRVDSEKKRYMDMYNINHYEMSNYDYVIDTTDKSIEQVVNRINDIVKKQ